MTDRELLELAAKAAGITWTRQHKDGEMQVMLPFTRSWNPLTDDGDALRLAVRLRINIVYHNYPNATMADPFDSNMNAYKQDHGDDPFAATRRAIVCAAAGIGRSME